VHLTHRGAFFLLIRFGFKDFFFNNISVHSKIVTNNTGVKGLITSSLTLSLTGFTPSGQTVLLMNRD